MTEILIENDASFFALLERVLNEEDIDPSEIKFKGYPKYEITLRGEDFNGGIPTRVMPSLVEFQKNLRNTYSHLTYGEKRKLTKEETKQTELVVYADDSQSTRFWADKVDEVLNQALYQAVNNMTGTETAITIILTVVGVAAVWVGMPSYKAKIAKQIREEELGLQLKLSEQETKRHEKSMEVISKTSFATDQHNRFEEILDSLAKSLRNNDKFVFDDGETIEAGVIKKLLKKEKEIPFTDKLDGNFKIMSVVSGGVKNGFKIKVQQDIEEGKIVTVMAPEGRLSDEQVVILKDSEWDKETLYMEIDVVKVGEEIIAATLVKASIRNSE